jgi:diguanylate cyclase (GGDEF)-like protein
MNEHSFAETPEERPPFESVSLYREVVEHITDVVCITDHAGMIVHSASRHTKIDAPATANDFYDRIHPEDRHEAQRAFLRVMAYRRAETITLQYKAMNDEWLWMECTGILHIEDGRDFVVVTMKDITQRKHDEDSLRRLAFHDPLTGLPNRRLFEERLYQAIMHAKRSRQIVALFYMDVDDFKLINDRMGHEIGDLFLISFAKRIKNCIREIDTFARMGGDEFTLLLPIVDSAESVEKVARRIMDAVKKGWDVAGTSFSTTASIGIALYPSDGDSAETLMRNVDTALYEVKSQGRNGYKFYTG